MHLTTVERRLLKSLQSGAELDLGHAEAGPPTIATRANTVRGAVIREALRGRLVAEPDPLGLRIRGAYIVGPLDLRNLRCVVGLGLSSCHVSTPLLLNDARIPWLTLDGSHVIELSGDGMVTEGPVFLRQHDGVPVRVTGGGARLVSSKIGGNLELDGAHFDGEGGDPATFALALDHITVEGDVFLRDGFCASGAWVDGAVRLMNARIWGQLDCRGATVTNTKGTALMGDRMTVGSLHLNNGFHASGHGSTGTVRLTGAHVERQATLSGATIKNEAGPAVVATSLTTNADVYLGGGLIVTAATPDPAVDLAGAHIRGGLQLGEGSIDNAEGEAVRADAATVEGPLVLEGLVATGSSDTASVRLTRARLGSVLQCNAATVITNTSGSAVDGDGIDVAADIFLRGARFAGSGAHGTVRLLGATVRGNLECDRATIEELNDDGGPALYLDGTTIAGHMFLRDRFTATTSSENATVRVVATSIGRDLDLSEAVLTNRKRVISRREPAQRASWVLDLEDSSAGSLTLPEEVLTSADDGAPALLSIDRFMYGNAPRDEDDVRRWVTWCRSRTTHYAAQPYRLVAQLLTEVGREKEARQVLIAHEDDRNEQLEGVRAATHWLFGRTIRYGYETGRAVMGLGLVVVISIVLALAAGRTHVSASAFVARAPVERQPPTSCSTTEQIGVALDIGLPLIAVAGDTRCEFDSDSATGQAFTVAAWILRLAAWATATLAVAGYTGIVRKVP